MQRILTPTRCLAGPPSTPGPARSRPPSSLSASTGASSASPLLRAAPPAAAPAAPTPVSAHVDVPALERAFDAPVAAARAPPLESGERATPLDAGEERPAGFTSTNEHRALVCAGSIALAAVYARALGGVDGGLDAVGVAAATVAGYYAADFGTGIYHWIVDNYGDGSTPGLGPQIAAFQGHHQRPWTITEREFANNCHTTFKPAALASAAWLVAVPASAPPASSAFFATLIACAALSQQFHAWAHGKPSTVPGPVRKLQAAGLLVSAKAHGAHHRAPFEGNYCIVSGAWNGLLDGAGFFRGLEKAVHALTGVEPRCWNEPDYGWVEEE